MNNNNYKLNLYYNYPEHTYIIQITLKNNLFFKWIAIPKTLNFVPIGICTKDDILIYELPQAQKQKFLVSIKPMSVIYLINFGHAFLIDKTNDILNNEPIPESIKLLLNL